MAASTHSELVARLKEYVPGLSGWAQINNQNHVLAALDALDASDLEYEIDFLLSTELFQDESSDELGDALVDMYSNLRPASEFTAFDLNAGWGDNCANGWTLEEYLGAARKEGVDLQNILGFIMEYVLPSYESQDLTLPDVMTVFLVHILLTAFDGDIALITDSKGGPPSEENGYLMSSDGKSFNGIFHSEGQEYPFKILDKGNSSWAVNY